MWVRTSTLAGVLHSDLRTCFLCVVRKRAISAFFVKHHVAEQDKAENASLLMFIYDLKCIYKKSLPLKLNIKQNNRIYYR